MTLRAVVLAAIVSTAASAQVSVLTGRNDNARTAANLSETTLTTSNVNVNQFGKLFTRPVDGYAYAQPLYVPNVNIPAGGIHNVVYVATMQNTVFAFDADDPTASTPLWQTNLGTPVTSDPPYLPRAGFAPASGILSTPVIDANTKTLYVVALILAAGNPVYQLHALDITTGLDKLAPVTIQGSIQGTGYDSQGGVITFNPASHLQRTALLLVNGIVYFAFASYGDLDPYHGWIFGYDATTLQQTSILNVTPDFRGGIWQSGAGLSADSNGFIYTITGDGTWDGIVNFGESFLRLNPVGGLSVADYFTPDNYAVLNAANNDVGSSSALLIPGTNGIVSGGKNGVLFVVLRNNMGHMVPGDNQVVQNFGSAAHTIYGGLAYWDNPSGPKLYVWPSDDFLAAYTYNSGLFGTNPSSTSPQTAPPTVALSVSANGGTAGSGIVWASTPAGDPRPTEKAGTLRAFDASNVATELWNSGQNAARDSVGTFAKFASPTIANGKVYLSTFSNQLVVYGLLPTAPLTVSPGAASVSAGKVQQFSANASATWTINPSNAGAISSNGLYTAPASIPSQQTVTVTATNLANTQTATATLTLVPVSVSVTPGTASLFASQTQQFTSTVTGSSNTSVTWTVTPNGVGTISAAGLYTAPASIAATQNVTVTATSAADASKLGTATVTLNPLVTPTVTQQPQDASAFVGQTATFSVVATGGGLTYQWQSKPSGAASYNNVAGATTPAYTTPVTVQTDSGTQFRCVVTNTQGPVNSNAATLTVLSVGTSFITSKTPGTLRNNYTGWVGIAVTVGPVPIIVNSLGRIAVAGNSKTHPMKIVNAANGSDVTGATTSVNAAAGAPGTFVYGAFQAPVTLSANTSYYILAQEINGADQWYDNNTTVTTTTNAAAFAAVYGLGPAYNLTGTAGSAYGPVDFKYVAISVAPTTVTLFNSQTQQFTATVAGLGNNSVTWSLSPNLGTISASGLYTAPSSIATAQPVTVTATSTVDTTKLATATVNLAVAVTITPTAASLYNSETQQFTSTVAGGGGVTWAISPSNAGSISSSGLYSAPASITVTQSVTVTVTSVADPTKSATAAVTLNPPASPGITQQPQDVTAVVGRTATFAVVATGGALTYQWQLKPPGGSFGNIGGATSNSYTTPAITLANNGTQYRVAVTNGLGSITSNAATLTAAQSLNFVTSTTPGQVQNDFTGWVGMSVTIGADPVVVNSLGRIVAPGNAIAHTVKIVDPSTGLDVPGGSVSVPTAGGTVGAFAYGSLANPVTLSANTTYYILSQETKNGEFFYDTTTTAQTTTAGVLNGPVYGTPYVSVAAPGHMYGPLDFSYTAPFSVSLTPTSASLFANETQQFTATVASNANTNVTWTINPNTGSISATGLYTAPAVIGSIQIVTVKAASVANANKFATATVTLNPPAAPTITQQPLSTTVISSQTASFSVTAVGGGLSYQWQSKLSGGVSFANIGGATSSSYTTPLTTLADDGTQFQCVVTNGLGSTPSNTATLSVVGPGNHFVTSTALGHVQNDFTGFVGMSITVGPTSIVVSTLGRIVAPGNTSVHTVKIVNAATGLDVPGGAASVNTAGGSVGNFVYGALPSPVILNANATYYVVSQETKNGEQFYDSTTTALTSNVATLTGPVYGPAYVAIATPGALYVPVDFSYTILVTVAPTAATLFAGETQQFTATVAGNGNTGVTWTINPPSAGSISSAGLYTAPGSIPSTQTVIVKATSVADSTKSASATVTLSPPTQPSITQQPLNTTVIVGQTASFSVTAVGGGLNYQWQLMPPGSGTFANIPAATSKSYITPPTALTDSGAQFQCVVTNAQGTATSNPATLAVLTAGSSFVTSKTLGTLRSNFSGWVGMKITVGPASLVVGALGRIVAPGNTATHTVKIVDATTNADLTGGSVAINTSGGSTGTFAYTTLATPVTLTANAAYYILSQETAGGDQWYDSDTTAQTTTDATLAGAAYGASPPYTLVSGTGGRMYVPVDFKYNFTISVSVAPTTANLSAGQTQQFTATVTGNNNTSVTWALTPNTNSGTITAGGLYTAPASITASQNVTVTATSAVDSTKSATATVTLVPVGVNVAPSTATLFDAETQQFTATVTGTNNTAVTWTIAPVNAGTISPTGLYTAPAPIASIQTVTVTATSAADNNKLATATVTLSPPTIPVVTQQPQNASIVAGQAASFSIAATGGGLAYQWQSKPPGGSFANIPSANSNSYVTPATVLTDSGTQFQCIVSNGLGPVTSNAATLTVTAPATNFITSTTLGHLQNDFTGFVGMSVTVGSAPLFVGSLGRFVSPGNTATHTVKIVDAASGNDVAGGSASVNTSGGTVGAFAYGVLANPVVLSPNATYYIVSQETKDGEQFYDSTTIVQTSTAGVLNGPVYGPPFVSIQAAGSTYVPVDFTYTAPVSITLTPPTASLFASDIQPFTATVTGSNNTSVTWTLNPAGVGSISLNGIYTAPGSVPTTQNVTVIATSVADISKSASSTVTLNPQASPVINQQPQNASVTAGQTASFSVAATGGALTYQWQSKPSGAGSFSVIGGATSISYTTPVTSLTDNGTQFRCVVTNGLGTATSTAATLSVLPPGANFVTSKILGTLRNNFTGSVGMKFTVGATPLGVTSLGRIVAPGNTAVHTVKLVDASTGLDIANGSASVSTAGGTAGSFAYGALAATVTLSANATYYLVSQETIGGDQWYDSDTTAQTTTAGVLAGPVYGTPYAFPNVSAGHMYVPVDFVYNVPISVSVAPPTASLSASQTQQFTATVTGNTAVTWTLNPNTGSITAGGLYTAPSSIASTQQITVTATSVADATKSANATVTLNPPAPPVITTQPQNATVTAGQTAAFSVTATGAGLTYQWQSKASGAGSFSAIGGATSSSYTTPATAQTDNGTQFQCVVSNLQGPVTSNTATLTVLAPGANFVTSKTLGGLRNNFTGWVGMKVTIGSTAVAVNSLGRMVAPGNASVHTVKLVDASTGLDVAGGSASVSTAGGTAGSFAYGGLAAPVTLNANATYYVVSQETSAADQWYDNDTTAQTTTAGVLNGPVYGTPYTALGAMAGRMYVPVDFIYNVPISVSVAPTTASLSASQTQQFTPTVTGSTGVTWTLNPNTGTITPGGLYTAPSSIASTQQVTVTATSVVDITKSANATVTLNPPAPPVITSQPQNATIAAGQTATFSVTATGGGLTYQWQSKPSGAGTFGSIGGATSSSYTTPVTAQTDNGTQFQCVVSNLQGPVTSTAATLSVLPPGVNFVTSKAPGTLRNNFTGLVGMKFTVGSTPLAVSSLGRIVAPGNTSLHTVKLVVASTGLDVAGGSASISTAGGTAGSFAYGALAATVTLNANTAYYLVSQETLGGDQWYDNDTTAQTTTAGVLNAPVYGTPYALPPNVSAGHMYVPVDFIYNVPISVSVAPTTASLSASQTQQFTATVTGSTGVTWTLNPNTGTITAGGLYTAPASIASTQQVTVTATSVADATKSANATVTLNPPAPPVITQQPQSKSVTAGQTATFSVTATGGGLTYQWQSKPSGAGTFGSIGGATSSSYTTPATSLSDNGTQFQCIVSNVQGPVTSNAATLSVLPPGANFVTSKTLGALRNNFTGLVGMKVTIGSTALAVSSLGRIVAPGNGAVHTVKLVDASTGLDVVGGSASISTAGGTAGSFAYGALAATVTLNANAAYYLVSQETLGGDQWYDNDTTAQTTTAGVLNGPVYGTPYTTPSAMAGRMYVPVDFIYNVPISVSVAPTTASLAASQTQQFTATVTGSTGVTWTLNPNTGTITAGGLYTAPASIASTQQVTVTATSVADATKSANATVTLNPPAPPVITTQPQNASVTVGQTATFSVTATGGGLTYQWQSKASGAGSFSSIGGATSSSYTTPVTALSDNGTQFQCIVSNTQGPVTSNAATLSVSSSNLTYVTSTTFGTIRNNYSGYIGMKLVVGSLPLSITSLGRIFAPGNAGTHQIKIIDASAGSDQASGSIYYVLHPGVDVPGGSTTVNMAGGTLGAFVYATLASPITLNANTPYYILSLETSGGDQWYDHDNTTATTTNVAALTNAVYGTASPYAIKNNSTSQMYGPVNFKYVVLPPAPTITQQPLNATAAIGQTATFSVTATGSSLTYQWQSMPSGGSFSPIAGAVSSSYTTPPVGAGDYGTQFRCVVNNPQGTATSNPATLSSPASGTNFVTSRTLGTLRNNYTGWVGMKITVGAAPITISALGRIVVSGNTAAHVVKIVDASTGNDIAGGSVSIGTSGGTAGTFVYGTLAAPVTLNASGVYFILSQETQGGDQWYDSDTTAQTTTDAALSSAAWGTGPVYISVASSAGRMYVPVDFKYTH